MLNTSFSKILPKLQLAWDSVSRGALMTCAKYYEYTIIIGYTTRDENIHFTFGIGTHGAYEIYHREKAEGKTHKEALRNATRYILEYTWDYKRNRPWLSENPVKNRETLIRTVIWYLIQFEEDVYKTLILENSKPAVEYSFHFDSQLRSITNEPYLLCGHLDRAATNLIDDYYIFDTKTTKSSLTKNTQEFFDKYRFDDQMQGYYFAGKIIFHEKPIKGLIIDAAQTAVNFSRFQRDEIYYSSSQLSEWYYNFEYWMRIAEKYAQDENYPRNYKSCHNYGGCPFLPVCQEVPEMRQKLLDDFYIKRTWDPLISREV